MIEQAISLSDPDSYSGAPAAFPIYHSPWTINYEPVLSENKQLAPIFAPC